MFFFGFWVGFFVCFVVLFEFFLMHFLGDCNGYCTARNSDKDLIVLYFPGQFQQKRVFQLGI